VGDVTAVPAHYQADQGKERGVSDRVKLSELREGEIDGAALLALIDVAEAAVPFTCPPIPCACLGPRNDSLPGECGCATEWRKRKERLTAALARFDLDEGDAA
jgi:hypothetical protein